MLSLFSRPLPTLAGRLAAIANLDWQAPLSRAHRGRCIAQSLIALLVSVLGATDVVQATEPALAKAQSPSISGPSATNSPSWMTGFDRARFPQIRNDLQLHGAASCAATACHGGSRPGIAVASAARGSEYPLWFESDPHSRSWRTICSDESLKMMERLKIFAGGEIVDRAGFDNCLACHNSTRQTIEPRSLEHIREGIGCSGCHGPDQRWRGDHFSVSWNRNAALDDGFAQTKNMLSRARICATCHVGDKDRDMNHDIIAAGHPALHYEFASYHQQQPKHWRESSTGDRFEAGQWIAGQFAALDASLVLLETRAGRQHSVSQWPELAIFDCSSCHQPLTAQSNLSTATAAPSKDKSGTFSRWNQFGVQELLRLREREGRFTDADRQLANSLQQLATTLKTLTADADQVQKAARSLRLAIDVWLRSPAGLAEVRDFNAARLLAIVQSASSAPGSVDRWESMTQIYLASVAGRAAWPNPQPTSPVQPRGQKPDQATAVGVSAEELRKALLFPNNTNSPPRSLPTATEKLKRHVQLILGNVTPATMVSPVVVPPPQP